MYRLFTRFCIRVSTLVIIASAHLGYGQQREVDQGNQQWLQYYIQSKVARRWSLGADASFRWADEFREKSTLLFRAGTSFNLLENVSLGGGVAVTGGYAGGKISKSEFRPYQDISYRTRYGSIAIIQRLRVEERFTRAVVDGHFAEDHDYITRLRFRVGAGIPIGNKHGPPDESKFSLSVADEIFINPGQNVVYNVFDKNRFLIGPLIKATGAVTVGLFYNHDFSGTTTAGKYARTHIFWLTVSQKVNIHSRKSTDS